MNHSAYRRWNESTRRQFKSGTSDGSENGREISIRGAGRVRICGGWRRAAPAAAHNEWANGKPVPDWVKAACCGPADAHHLRPDQVHDEGDFYTVDGYSGGPDNGKIYKTVSMGNGRSTPNPSIIPSQDGDYWIFYRDGRRQCDRTIGGASACTAAAQSNIYCFFVPMDF